MGRGDYIIPVFCPDIFHPFITQLPCGHLYRLPGFPRFCFRVEGLDKKGDVQSFGRFFHQLLVAVCIATPKLKITVYYAKGQADCRKSSVMTMESIPPLTASKTLLPSVMSRCC